MCPLYVACVSTGLSLSRQKRPSRMQKKSNVRQKKALKRYLLQKDTTDVSFVLSSSASHYFTTVQKILTTNVRQKKTKDSYYFFFSYYFSTLQSGGGLLEGPLIFSVFFSTLQSGGSLLEGPFPRPGHPPVTATHTRCQDSEQEFVLH